MTTTITGYEVFDLRFPTSQQLDGSDAMNPDPDYSAAYVVLKTDSAEFNGCGMTFTIGRGNELCCAGIRSVADLLVDQTVESLMKEPASLYRRITGDSQLRWVGPEKGVIHLATAAVINAVWDLYAKIHNKPIWQLVCDMSPEEFAACVDFRYITDALTPTEAVELLQRNESTKQQRIEELQVALQENYTTAASLIEAAVEEGRNGAQQ